jgi:hypothetical protein
MVIGKRAAPSWAIILLLSGWRRSRIPAAKERPVADNFLQKQQKHGGASVGLGVVPSLPRCKALTENHAAGTGRFPISATKGASIRHEIAAILPAVEFDRVRSQYGLVFNMLKCEIGNGQIHTCRGRIKASRLEHKRPTQGGICRHDRIYVRPQLPHGLCP